MSTVRKLSNGRYQATAADKRRGIARTRRTFDTKKEANEWLDAVKRDNQNRLLGHQRRYVFGQALARFLKEDSPKLRPKSHQGNLDNARVLRWPFKHKGHWIWLEEAELADVPELMRAWELDQREVQLRSRLRAQNYQYRPYRGGLAWYLQPEREEGGKPPKRVRVTDPDVLKDLSTRAKPRGPFSNATLRQREILVREILGLAYRVWSTRDDIWLDKDISSKVAIAPKPPGRVVWLTYEALRALVIHAPIGLDVAILAAAWIGWRKGNVLGNEEITGLEWKNVSFPVYQNAELVQLGMFLVESGEETKAGNLLAQPMSDRVEQLLRLCWDSRPLDSKLVFCRPDGKPWGNFTKLWNRTKRQAAKYVDLPDPFRWHDLRHSFATEMIRAGATDSQLQVLGGWATSQSMKVYAHLRVQDVHEAANLPGKKRT